MLITCKNVSFGYEGRAIIKNLNFAVEPGDYLWVVGENGSGKTTLISGLLGLLSPLEGSITFSNELGRGKIGYLSQQAELKKDFPAGVFEVVLSGNLSGMGLRPFYNAIEKERAEDAMDLLGIKDLKKKCYRELSGGQQRRILLARAFCAAQINPTGKNNKTSDMSSRLLVLDEPTSGLDPLITVEVYELLKTLNQQTGISIIMVSHDTKGAESYAKHILQMNYGQGFFATTADYLNSDMGKKFFGGERSKTNAT